MGLPTSWTHHRVLVVSIPLVWRWHDTVEELGSELLVINGQWLVSSGDDVLCNTQPFRKYMKTKFSTMTYKTRYAVVYVFDV